MSVAWRIYQRLAEAFPHEFKMVYGAEVTGVGRDVVEDIARRNGPAGLIRLVADIAIRVPIEYLSEMRRDMRHALRALIKSPGFALVGIISMGLCIGLTTNVYSTKWAMLFRDLPAAENAKSLVMPMEPASYYYIEQYRQQTNLFSGVAAFQNGVPFNVTFQGDRNARPLRVFGQLVSADYFSVLGVHPQRGRMLSPALDRAGDAPTVVISDRFWQNRLNAAPDAVGQILRLNGQIATIVGIAPQDFNGALGITPAELFVPLTVPSALAPELSGDILHQPNTKAFLALMCMAPGVTIDAAEVALDTIARRLDAQDTTHAVRTDKGRRITLLPAGTRIPVPRKLRPVLAGFLGALMGLVIVLACTNLANMLIARGAARRKELGIRLAVGASRFRLVRQMMSEGILLSLLGGVAGFAIAFGLSILNSRFAPRATLPVDTKMWLDWHTGVFAFALALICGVGFSLAPALQATKADLAPSLKEGSTRLPGYGRFSLRNLLMVAQVAASLMLLLMTGFLVMGISKTSGVETNFDPNTMYLVSIDPVRDGYAPEKAQALFKTLPERLKNSGPVRSIALSAQSPFLLADDDDGVQLTVADSGVQQSVVKETVGADYFAALSQPMLTGREFEERDQRAPQLPAILNESAAHKLFGNENAIGKLLRDDDKSYQVVGVVRDLKNGIGISQSVIFLPLTERDFARPPSGGITILVRAAEGDVLTGIRREMSAIDPNLTLFNVQTLHENLDRTRAATRFSIETYGGIGVFGLILAAIGLAGVTGYAVVQRRKEIAIRTALGATKAQVLWLVLREGAALVIAGSILGFVGAVAMAKALAALTSIFVDALKVGTDDLRLLAGAPLLLAAVAMLACYIPARRSAKIDPVKALRE
jgi:macrolide transport system ATP-binding/permease protein